MTKHTTCTREGCGAKHKARGLCNKHYLQLTRGKTKITDVERFWSYVVKGPDCWDWPKLTPAGYGRIRFDRRMQMAHRISYELRYGPIPEGKYIDHRCLNRACVNPDHLRIVTIKENNENMVGAKSNNKLGIRGVRKHATGRYEARVSHSGVTYSLGLFDTAEAAEIAAIAKRNELFTHNELDRALA